MLKVGMGYTGTGACAGAGGRKRSVVNPDERRSGAGRQACARVHARDRARARGSCTCVVQA
jgi:hypothetical protein